MVFVEVENKIFFFFNSHIKPNKTPNIRVNNFPSPVVSKMPKNPHSSSLRFKITFGESQ